MSPLLGNFRIDENVVIKLSLEVKSTSKLIIIFAFISNLEV